tara:strand:+ start:569 stop:970 length:402 start_codon:yes stop_codon:yes gene_type:complete
MEKIPYEILQEIFYFIPSSTKKLLNKNLFKSHYFVIITQTEINKRYHNYMRHLLYNNCYLHIQINLDIHYLKLLKLKKWRYKNNTYPNYLIFMKSFALYNNSQKTYQLLKDYLHPSKKNKYKRIRTKNIRWTN